MKKRYKLLILAFLAGFVYLMVWSNYTHQARTRAAYEEMNK